MIVERWSVWLAGLDPTVGSEQGKTRPVLVLSRSALNEKLPVVNVIPITSRKPDRRIYPNEASLDAGIANLPNESIALCFQIRTLDKRRLIKRIGDVGDNTIQAAVIEALSFQLEIR